MHGIAQPRLAAASGAASLLRVALLGRGLLPRPARGCLRPRFAASRRSAGPDTAPLLRLVARQHGGEQPVESVDRLRAQSRVLVTLVRALGELVLQADRHLRRLQPRLLQRAQRGAPVDARRQLRRHRRVCLRVDRQPQVGQRLLQLTCNLVIITLQLSVLLCRLAIVRVRARRKVRVKVILMITVNFSLTIDSVGNRELDFHMSENQCTRTFTS